MFSIFKKKLPESPDFSGLVTDMHSHMLPGIDDGSPDAETSLVLLKGLEDLGFSNFVCTPHIYQDLYKNDAVTIGGAKTRLQRALQEESKTTPIHAAAEYFMDDHFEKLLETKTPLLPLWGNKVLVEFSFVSAPFNYKEILFEMQMNNYQPVLAHPERYTYFGNNKKIYEEIRTAGCLLQVNMLSLIGYYGKPTQELAQYLIKNKLVDLLGTDLHHVRHLEALRSAGALNPVIDSLLQAGCLENSGVTNKE